MLEMAKKSENSHLRFLREQKRVYFGFRDSFNSYLDWSIHFYGHSFHIKYVSLVFPEFSKNNVEYFGGGVSGLKHDLLRLADVHLSVHD